MWGWGSTCPSWFRVGSTRTRRMRFLLHPLARLVLTPLPRPRRKRSFSREWGHRTQTFEQIYNFYDYGFRIGHMGLTNTTQVAPELYSYLDFSLGRFSNLESLICHRVDQRGTTVANSGCISAFGSQYTVDSRKRLYRIDIEGLLKIPSTPIYLGLNANIGQKQVMAEKLDPNFAAPNDLRFLFGPSLTLPRYFRSWV